MVDAKFFPILEKNLFNSSAMALSFLISCPSIINLLGEFEPLDLILLKFGEISIPIISNSPGLVLMEK